MLLANLERFRTAWTMTIHGGGFFFFTLCFSTIFQCNIIKCCVDKCYVLYLLPMVTHNLSFEMQTFNKLVGKFSQSIFHLNLTQILSATMEGKLVVWDIYRPPSSASTSSDLAYIKPCKLVHLQREGITVLTTVDR